MEFVDAQNVGIVAADFVHRAWEPFNNRAVHLLHGLQPLTGNIYAMVRVVPRPDADQAVLGNSGRNGHRRMPGRTNGWPGIIRKTRLTLPASMRCDMAQGGGNSDLLLNQRAHQGFRPKSHRQKLRRRNAIHRQDVHRARGPGAMHPRKRVGGVLNMAAVLDHLARVDAGRHHAGQGQHGRHGQHGHRTAPTAPQNLLNNIPHSKVTVAVPSRQ